ncbi:putative adhesin [Streptomyces hainanensis]|uniref:RHS repeat protein n=1 Tax=Streptomyces hainanensis TaxID=402648 RepID=A0A4R4T8U5_9ACTN|nr:DUF6531 domain-containing protein [Streptomyces hainanensis]TDC73500.1 RHS repeat protein [Streptomyces hainanensis]
MGRGGDNLVCRTDPIDMATGEMVMDAVDVELPGVLPLVVRRHHRTSLREGTWFGRSWASTLDQRLVFDEAGLRFVTADGMILDYPRPMPGEAVMPVEGPRWGLSWDGQPGTPLTIHQRETGQTLHFAPTPGRKGGELPLTAITDRNDNRIDLHYDATGAPTDVVHHGGYHLGITTNDGRITELRLLSAPDQPTLLRYAYDEHGNLTRIFNSSSLPLTLSYDERRRITGWEDRNGTWYRYTYDDAGRCVATDGTDGYLASRIAYDADTHRTLFTDSLGNTTVYQFNDSYQLVTETDPLGHHTHRTHDRYDRLRTLVDPLGRTTTYGYEDGGDLVAVTRPDGRQAHITRNTFGQATEVVREDGAVWRQEFDARGNQVSATDPAGAVTRYTVDDHGRPVATTDALGNTSRLAFDAAGLMIASTDPSGATLTVRRDSFGRPLRVTEPTGATLSWEWTVEGRPVRRADAQGGVTEWTWDPEGNPLTLTDESGSTTRWTYGPFDQPTAQLRPDGARFEFTRDTELRTTRVTAPGGLTWEYTVDAAGRPVEEVDFDGRAVRYAYDPAGQLVSRTNAMGQRVDYTHDANGVVVGKDVDGRHTAFTLDAAGQIVGAQGPDAVVELARDQRGMILAETLNSRTVRHQYDLLGRPVARTTPSGHHTAYAYDPVGHQAELVSGGHRLAFERNAAGQETGRAFGTDTRLDQRWDDLGRLVEQELTAERRTVRHRAYRYQPNRYLAAVDDSLTGATAFTLDPEGRVTAVEAQDRREAYGYDALGNQVEAAWPERIADLDAAGERRYAGTRVVAAGRFRHEYDAAGRTVLRQRKRLSGGIETWRYEWDAEDRLTAVVTPDGTRWRYRHDPFGRRIAKQRLAADGSVAEQTDYAWFGSTLIEETASGDPTAAAVTRTWDYDGIRPVAQTERVSDDDIDARFYAIVTDLVGTPTELVDPEGRVAWQARSTLWGAALPDAGADAVTDTPLRFPGQYADPETGWHYNVHRHYDPATARYTSPDPLGLAPAANPVAYVHNPHSWADPLGLAPCPPGTVDPYRGGRHEEIVFYGHGGVETNYSVFTVPEGTSVHFYSRHGEVIYNDLGLRIVMANPAPVRVWGPGSQIPDYILFPPGNLPVIGNPRIVAEPVRLSSLLQPNMGNVHWSACRSTF